MTVQEIIKKHLKDNGYDGLCYDDCGCGIENIAPCDQYPSDCVPAYAWKCEKCAVDCEYRGDEWGCYKTEKQE